MSEGGYPAVDAGGQAESPVPAGYGALDDVFPPTEAEAAERQRTAAPGRRRRRRDSAEGPAATSVPAAPVVDADPVVNGAGALPADDDAQPYPGADPSVRPLVRRSRPSSPPAASPAAPTGRAATPPGGGAEVAAGAGLAGAGTGTGGRRAPSRAEAVAVATPAHLAADLGNPEVEIGPRSSPDHRPQARTGGNGVAARPPGARERQQADTGPASPGGFYDDADVEAGPIRGKRRPRQKVRLVRGVRSRRLVRRLDVWTVIKVSFVFYLLALIVLIVAGVIVWNVANALGYVGSIEKSVRTLFSLKTFTLHPRTTLAYFAAIGGVLSVVGVLVNTLAAVTYNLISDVVGGVQIVVVTEVDSP